jgi:hypothetical protein
VSFVSRDQDNDSVFGDPIGDYDSDTTTNILISKERDIKTKLDPSKMKVDKEINWLKSWFNPEASNVMEALLSERESILEGTDVAFFLSENSEEPQSSMEPTIILSLIKE